MSKIDQLITTLCPDGVEYKTLSSIATITRGGSLQKKDFCENGIPCIHYGQIYTQFGLFTDHALTFVSHEVAKRQRKAKHGDIVMAVTSENVEDVCKCVVWLGNEDAAVSGHTAIISSNQNPKYLAYYFHSSLFFSQKRKLAHGTKVIEVTPDKLNDIIIPVPPIEVQREIVRILDNFTELTAELTARQKQYEYYRDYLLSFPEITSLQTVNVERERERERRSRAVRWLTLNKIASTFRGEYITKSGTTEGSVPVILGGQEPAYYINKSNHSGEVVVISRSGASAGFVSYWNQDVFITDGFGYDANPDIMSPRFLYYTLKNKEQKLNAMKRGAGVPHISGAALGEMLFPVPSYEEQERIVSILDRFDALCNDISEDIPAEIEARRQQYEYYRDKLLTFKEKT